MKKKMLWTKSVLMRKLKAYGFGATNEVNLPKGSSFPRTVSLLGRRDLISNSGLLKELYHWGHQHFPQANAKQRSYLLSQTWCYDLLYGIPIRHLCSTQLTARIQGSWWMSYKDGKHFTRHMRISMVVWCEITHVGWL